jgi:hypothetical protein
MLPMQMPVFDQSVQVIKVAFGRFQMALTLRKKGQTAQEFVFHTMLFPAAYKDRVEAQAARIQSLLDAGHDARSLINPALWYAPHEKPKLSVFKPKTA